MSNYTLTRTLDTDVEDADRRVRAALAERGFGVLSEIDVQGTLQSKLGEDIGVYRILGACSPPLARRAIAADADIGALLPCNVVLRANPAGGTDVVAVDPVAMLSVASDNVAPMAAEVRDQLEQVLASLTEPAAA